MVEAERYWCRGKMLASAPRRFASQRLVLQLTRRKYPNNPSFSSRLPFILSHSSPWVPWSQDIGTSMTPLASFLHQGASQPWERMEKDRFHAEIVSRFPSRLTLLVCLQLAAECSLKKLLPLLRSVLLLTHTAEFHGTKYVFLFSSYM